MCLVRNVTFDKNTENFLFLKGIYKRKLIL